VANVDAQRERDDGGAGEAHHGHDGNDRLFETWSYESDRPVSLESLREMVRKELPASIYRCKGIVFAADSPDKRIALQIVGRRTEISELDEWGDRTPRTQIVAIGASINAQQLSNQFDACIEQD
jgi:G3E family GTPase